MENLTPAQATVLAALLSALAAIVVSAINARQQRRKFIEDMRERDAAREKAEAVRNAKLEVWMETVDKKLDSHNAYAEKFTKFGEAIAEIRTDVKNLYRKGV
ncbi:MAG: hypothetical protein IKD61_05515 [Oscillospiraceae bacterium]|nr:hypothetical protein [Oscillospiraceae bacterium]